MGGSDHILVWWVVLLDVVRRESSNGLELGAKLSYCNVFIRLLDLRLAVAPKYS